MSNGAKPMTIEEFRDRLAEDSTNIDSCADSARTAAQELLQQSAEARDAQNAALILDDGLAELAGLMPPSNASERVTKRVLLDAERAITVAGDHNRRDVRSQRALPRRVPKHSIFSDASRYFVTAGAGAAAAIGIWIGYADPTGFAEIAMTTVSGEGPNLYAMLDNADLSNITMNESEL